MYRPLMYRLSRQLAKLAVGAIVLAASANPALADRLRVPQGMGGVPDIGAIPCSVLNEMVQRAPLGTRHSLLTWAAGYLNASTGLTLQQVADGAPGGAWTYDRLALALAGYCADNPERSTREAVVDLAGKLRPAAAASAEPLAEAQDDFD